MLPNSIRKILIASSHSTSPILVEEESLKDVSNATQIWGSRQKNFKALDSNLEFPSILNRPKKSLESSNLPNIRKIDTSDSSKEMKGSNHTSLEYDINSFLNLGRKFFQNTADIQITEMDIREDLIPAEDISPPEEEIKSEDMEEAEEVDHFPAAACQDQHQKLLMQNYTPECSEVSLKDICTSPLSTSYHSYNSFGIDQYEMQNYSFPKKRIEPQIHSLGISTSANLTNTENIDDSEKLIPENKFIYEVEARIVNGIKNGQNNILISLNPPNLGLINVEIMRTKRGKISEIKFVSSVSETSNLLKENQSQLIQSLGEIVDYDDISLEFEEFPGLGLSGKMSYISDYSSSEECIFDMEL